jgi:LacI family transcriptional regulator
LRFPIVLVNPGFVTSQCASISSDNVAGARAMVRHLAAEGHRTIAFIGGPRSNQDAKQRHQGYRDALRELGLPVHEDLELAAGFTESSGYDAARRLLARSSRPDAVFCANDCMAVGALSATREAGLHVPHDIAIGGFDDITIARYLTPRLTTVQVDAYRLGERAAHRLLEALQEQGVPRLATQEVLSTSLVVRESTLRSARPTAATHDG